MADTQQQVAGNPQQMMSRGQHDGRQRSGNSGARPGLWMLGLAALGIGAVAAYYMYPDLRRYMKIESM